MWEPAQLLVSFGRQSVTRFELIIQHQTSKLAVDKERRVIGNALISY